MKRYDIYNLTEKEIENLSETDINLIAESYNWNIHLDKFKTKEEYIRSIKNEVKEAIKRYHERIPKYNRFFDELYNDPEIVRINELCEKDPSLREKYFQEIKQKFLEIAEVLKELEQK